MKASELISAALDELHGPSKLSQILFKVKTIAHLLKSEQLKEWVNLELNGYPNSVPEYRIIGVVPRATVLHVDYPRGPRHSNYRIPTENLSKEERLPFIEKAVHNSIAEVEDWAAAEQGVHIEIPQNRAKYLSDKLFELNYVIYSAWQVVPPSQLTNLLLAVRVKLQELLLEFSDHDELFLQSLQGRQAINETVSKALNPITITGGNVNISHGAGAVQAANSGDAAQLNTAGNDATQSAPLEHVSSLHDLVETLKQLLEKDKSFDFAREEIDHEIERIEVQLQKPEPKKSIVKRAFESIQDLAAKGAGVAAGNAVFELLKHADNLINLLN